LVELDQRLAAALVVPGEHGVGVVGDRVDELALLRRGGRLRDLLDGSRPDFLLLDGHGFPLCLAAWVPLRQGYDYAEAAAARSLATSSSDSYSSPVSCQSSKAMTPSSVNFSRSQPSAASISPSFLQFGTIFENSICWNITRSGACMTSWVACLTSTPMRSQTSCCRKRPRMR